MIYKKEFSERLYSDWLPSYCNSRDHRTTSDGFLEDRLEKVDELDAQWFLRAIDAGYVTEESGHFLSDASAAKECIFWEGSVKDRPRKLSLWLEPIITIGAVARLIEEYQWPPSQIGLQSKYPWPFDLMGYGVDDDCELLACEVKKSEKEILKLIVEMKGFSEIPVLAHEPEKPVVKNAYKKIVGIRRSWPAFFWALGDAGKGQLFKIDRKDGGDVFSMLPVTQNNLRYITILDSVRSTS